MKTNVDPFFLYQISWIKSKKHFTLLTLETYGTFPSLLGGAVSSLKRKKKTYSLQPFIDQFSSYNERDSASLWETTKPP
jgi:hypothetical protein